MLVDPDVYYSCGSCGYPLHLCSSQRMTSSSCDRRSSRKGDLNFFSIEGSRIRQFHEFKCAPYIHTDGSMGFHISKTKLLCGKCGNVIGHGLPDSNGSGSDFGSSSSGSDSGGGSEHMRYCLKLKALQPCVGN